MAIEEIESVSINNALTEKANIDAGVVVANCRLTVEKGTANVIIGETTYKFPVSDFKKLIEGMYTGSI